MKIKITKMGTMDIINVKTRVLYALRNNYEKCTFWRGRITGIALPDPRLKW